MLDRTALYNRAACFSETTHTKSKNNVNMYSLTVRLCAKKNVKIPKKEMHKGGHFLFTTYTLSLKQALSFVKLNFKETLSFLKKMIKSRYLTFAIRRIDNLLFFLPNIDGLNKMSRADV